MATSKALLTFDGRPMLTAAEQLKFLEANTTWIGKGSARAGHLSWMFEAIPSSFGRLYRARIKYWQGRTPRVFIDAPNLTALAKGRKLPHTYRDSSLCLYQPRRCEWEPWMRLDETIVPWTILWLYYFEEWLVSDDWKGGGEHLESATDRQRRHESAATGREH
jgi:hypothetical protein